MMRRRRKDERDERHGRARPPRPSAPPSPPASRRRARPGATVPPELRVDAVEPRVEPAAVVLLTGFDPFDGADLNPSWEVCKRLAGRTIEGMRVETCKVPCEFHRSIQGVAAAVRKHRPAIVLCIGQAGGRAHVSVERVAINVDDARIVDNAGGRPIDQPIARDGPAAYFATVPVKAMTAAMREARVPAMVSNSAGTFVCNHLMYGVLHFLAKGGGDARAGFIHVPYAEEQVLDKPAMPALSIDTMARGVEAAIAAARRHATDIKVSEGALD